MVTQTIGNLGGTASPPVSGAAAAPKPAGPQREATTVGATSQQAASPQPSSSPDEVRKAVEEMRKSMTEAVSSNLQFAVDDDTGETIVRVTDRQTGELIRQIPSQEMVELAKSLDKMQGKLLRQEA